MICQLKFLKATGCVKEPMASIIAVFFWWSGYGYFSQSPGRR
jgi:hypothetical protein